MRYRFSANLAAILLGSVLAACGGAAPEGETEQAPVDETAAAETDPAIFEEGFEAGDNQDWSDSDVDPEDEDSEPEVPERH